MVKGLFSNPAFVGAASALATYIIVEELFDDPIEDFFDMLKGKKKKGGKGKKRVKMIKNKFGEVVPYIEQEFSEVDYDYGDSYFGGWERAYY